MLTPSLGIVQPTTRSNWVRLRTLVLLRWMAIFGQLVAITVADRYVGVVLDLELVYLAVGAAVIANLAAVLVAPENKRLSEGEAMLTLLFDIAQLSFLLFLTGGINNPFALLILGPVTISATVMQLRTTLFLGTVAIVLVSVLALFAPPLMLETGEILAVPPLYEFGTWLAIVVGIVFLGLYSRRVATEMAAMSDALFATQAALAREQKLTDLGGVVAAAAHELGTPLATIKLVSSELVEELDDPTLREDAALIRSQADRCRDILRSMGQVGKDDLHLRQAPLAAVLREAAEPHANRGKTLRFLIPSAPDADPRQPSIQRRPEVIHGLRNLIQNAVDFARSTVWIEAEWTSRSVTVRIIDDGTGFPPQMLGRIGDPFLRRRRFAQAARRERKEYDGMGLGLFIAKTLLERSGAELTFGNGGGTTLLPRPPGRLTAGAASPSPAGDEARVAAGAIVEVVWPRDRISADPGLAMGENRPLYV